MTASEATLLWCLVLCSPLDCIPSHLNCELPESSIIQHTLSKANAVPNTGGAGWQSSRAHVTGGEDKAAL